MKNWKRGNGSYWYDWDLKVLIKIKFMKKTNFINVSMGFFAESMTEETIQTGNIQTQNIV